MKQKALTLRDIEVRSDGKITDGYVADILRGAASNPSAEKIKALGRGLGVDAHALFDVICGPFELRKGELPGNDTSDVQLFLEMMQEVAESPELVKLVEEAVQLLPDERAVVLEVLNSLSERRRKTGRRKKPPRGRE
jgi:transcriptional regulator with XRE-family HTH domain